MPSDSASAALAPRAAGTAPLPARLVLKLPAQEQLAALSPAFRVAPHRLLLGLQRDPFGASAAAAGPRGVRRILDAGGYWIVYRVLPGEPLSVVVEAIRRRRAAGPAPARPPRAAPPEEVEDPPVLRARGPAGAPH